MAARPLSLTELDGVITTLSYPAIERRLASLRLVAQIEAVYTDGRRTPYAVTDWLREGVAPLTAAARWEHVHAAAETPAFDQLDAEAALLLAAPLIRLPAGSPGTCRITVVNGEGNASGGAMICVDERGFVSSGTQRRGDTDAWALGPATAVLSALVEPSRTALGLGGDRKLARNILDQLHNALFGALSDAKAA